MTESKNNLNSYYYSYDPSTYLFGSDYMFDHKSSASIPLLRFPESNKSLTIENFVLAVPPFQIEKNSQLFINPQKLLIDLKKLRVGIYRVIAVHNFQIEDCNPRLQECLAGIFLAGQLNGNWEEPENSPIECRTIEILGYVDTEKGKIL